MNITKAECYLDPEFLNKLWVKYVERKTEGQKRAYYYQPSDYARVGRRGYLSQEFEMWLWEHGASVRQINGKCYLEFVDAKKATMFSLRWA